MQKAGAYNGIRSRQSTSGRKRRLLFASLLFGLVSSTGRADIPLRQNLPVPCAGGCGPNGAWISYGAVDAPNIVNNTMHLEQKSDKAILNWSSFDIAPGYGVQFHQPDTGSVALNRIYQADPSLIQGRLGANGQVYLINQNGIVFGSGAQIDIHTLLASSLNISDDIFIKGITTPINNTVGDKNALAPFLDNHSNPLPSGAISIEAGANISAQPGGKIMVFAPQIENRGVIQTKQGQIILAAGDKIYIEPSSDSNLRGLWVEVDSSAVQGLTQILNTGEINAEQGNATLMAMAINQAGRISATSSVALNGSIHLLARSGAAPDTLSIHERKVVGSQTGAVVFGENSVTQVIPVDDGSTSVMSAVYGANGEVLNPSVIEVMGKTIVLEPDSLLLAPAGEVVLTALENPLMDFSTKEQSLLNPDPTAASIMLREGSRIDVAGVDAELPMERNQLEILLSGNELADAPLQRNGILYRQKVYLDARKGTPLANIEDYLGNMPVDIGEKSASGGTLSLQSEGLVDMQAGAEVDVSGGTVRYQDGFIKSTKLLTQGKAVDISEADPNQIYTGILGEHIKRHEKWAVTETWMSGAASRGEFVPGYTEGRNAGTITIQAHSLNLDGDLSAHSTRGEYQRAVADLPQGGALVIGQALYNTDGVLESNFAPAVSFEQPTGAPGELVLSSDLLTQSGFNRLRIRSDGTVTLPEDSHLQFSAGGELVLAGSALDIQGDVTAPNGSISLETVQFLNNPQDTLHDLVIGSAATLDTSGQWVNDRVSPPDSALTLDGGSIRVSSAADVILKQGSVIDVSGGGWLAADGGAEWGRGGYITLAAHQFNEVLGTDSAKFELGAELRAYAMIDGGGLSLEANNIVIQAQDDPTQYSDNTLVLSPEFFATGGFDSFELTANQGGLTVADSTQLDLVAHNLQLSDNDFITRPTGAELEDFTRVTQLLPHERQATDLTLNVDPRASASMDSTDSLKIGAGARVTTEAGGTLELNSGTRILVAGELQAPGGSIHMALERPAILDTDVGYLPDQTIWLAPGSRLDVNGGTVLAPNVRGMREGVVHDGGEVLLDASRRGFVVIEAGAGIEASGTRAVLDLPSGNQSVQSVEVASVGGNISIKAAEGLLLEGLLAAHAGRDDLSGGSLTVALSPAGRDNKGESINNPFPDSSSHTITVEPQRAAAAFAPEPGDDVSILEGQARLVVSKVEDGGFDSLNLQSHRNIDLVAGTSLGAGGSIVLDAPVISVSGSGEALVQSHYIALGNSLPANQQTGQSPQAGAGRLRVEAAGLLDLTGNLIVDEVEHIALHSAGDLRLRGVLDQSELRGSLVSEADTELAADRIYPTTLAQFDITAPDRITVLPGDTAAGTILSAGGSMTLRAEEIIQAGVLKAPLGEIVLDAGGNLVLASGSVTDVSAHGAVIPFGRLNSGLDWVYPIPGLASPHLVEQAPEKRIDLQAEQIDIQAGASLDLSGGGEVQAYEFVPGTGGTRDILANDSGRELYAVIPALGSEFAAFDPHIYDGSSLQPGDSVYLAGLEGLPAGRYALLPARYALLPGAYLIEAHDEYQDLPSSTRTRLYDGSILTAGYFTRADGTVREGRTRGFSVRPGTTSLSGDNQAAVAQLGEYTQARAAEFIPEWLAKQERATGRLPLDAGVLVLEVGESLNIDGSLHATPADEGRGGAVDIMAESLALMDAAHGGAALQDFVLIDVAELSRLGAESLLLGGRRTTGDEGTRIEVATLDLRVGEDVALTAPEILLSARDSVSVEAGARLSGSGTIGRSDEVLEIAGDGALLRVSAGGQARIRREYEDGTVPGQTGDLSIVAGSEIAATGSVIIDAARDMQFDGELQLADGSLNIGASSISLGAVLTGQTGFVLDPQTLAAFQAEELILTSRDAVNIFGPVEVAAANLLIEAGGLHGYEQFDGAASVITAQRLEVANRNGVSAGQLPVDTAGTLQLNAERLVLGDGEFSIEGFTEVALNAAQDITGSGQAELNIAASAVLDAGRIGLTSGADVVIAARSRRDNSPTVYHALTITSTAAAVGDVDGLGANLNLIGNNIKLDGRIELPSGSVSLIARGDGPGADVHITERGSISVEGSARTFADSVLFAPAGSIELGADHGDIVLDQGSRLDLAGAAAGGDAGKLAIHAPNGNAVLVGTIDATAGTADARGGVLDLDLSRLPQDYESLNAVINEAGFSAQQSLRLRTGDVSIGAGSEIKTQEYKLVADTGRIEVQGVIDASGREAGQVELWAGKSVTLRDGAVIDAGAEGAQQNGGRVLLAAGNTAAPDTRETYLSLQDGAVVNVAGTGAARDDGSVETVANGKVQLRTPRTDNGAAITEFMARVSGAESVTVEAVKVTELAAGAQITAATIAGLQNETQAFMDAAASTAQAAQLESQLAQTSDADVTLHYRPGVELRGAGDLTLAADWNLAPWRFGALGEAGVLTLRARGDLRLQETLSDGFNDVQPTSRLLDDPQAWSYRLVAGADLGSADVMALQPDVSAGSVMIAPGIPGANGNSAVDAKMLRTSSGDIQVAAAGDVILGNQQSVIYTAGIPVARRAGTASDTAIYPTNGGDVRIRAGGDVRMDNPASESNPDQLISAWLHREGGTIANRGGSVTVPANWWVNTRFFEQGIGALGGGNVEVSAGGDIRNVSVVLPTVKTADASAVLNGGNLDVQAGGDILGGVFFLGKGEADIRAGGSLGYARDNLALLPDQPAPVYPLLVLGEGQMRVTSNDDLTLLGVVNPGILWQSLQQFNASGYNTTIERLAKTKSSFFSYGIDSGVDLLSLAGDITLDLNTDVLRDATLVRAPAAITGQPGADNELAALASVLPPRVRVGALQGGIELGSSGAVVGIYQYPVPEADLQLLAYGDIQFGDLRIQLPDNTEGLPTLAAPNNGVIQDSLLLPSYIHADTPVALSGTGAAVIPVRVITQAGDIRGGEFYLNKAAHFEAGRDIRDLDLQAQNLSEQDVTRVIAGRDIRFREDPTRTNFDGIEVLGPGALHVQAGRNVNLGNSSGLVTSGNIKNGALPDAGARISVLAGYQGEMRAAAASELLAKYREPGSQELASLTKSLRVARQQEDLTEAEVLLALEDDPAGHARELFFNELKVAGRAENFARAQELLQQFFPLPDGERYHSGDIQLFLSQIRTLSGGDIDLMALGGGINAGLAVPPSGFGKKADELGIVAQSLGRVRAYVDQDVIVNQSRLFALRGGDITLWAENGDIDAGKGRKSVVSAPPPVITTDAQGNTQVKLSGAAQGSGIRIITTLATDLAGDMDLVAPKGEISAGEAGIAAAGDLYVFAPEVDAGGGIEAGGSSVGVPTEATTSVAAGLASSGSDGSAVGNSIEQALSGDVAEQLSDTPLADAAMSFLEVEVLGFGSDAQPSHPDAGQAQDEAEQEQQ